MSPRSLHLASAAALVLSLVAPGARAAAPSIALSDDAGPPRTPLRVTGSGFAPQEQLAVAFDHRVLKAVTASAGGAFSARITVPATATPGQHTVSAKGQVSGRATAPFIVRTDWPTFHFDDAKTGENPYENVLDPSNVGELEVAWAADLRDAVRSAPAVVEGLIHAANSSMEVFAQHPSNGEMIWRRRLEGCCPSDVTVAEGRLYVSSLTAHAMYILDAGTGEVLKTVPGPTHAPTVVDGVAYVTNSSPDGTLWAFDAETGEEIWAYHTPGWGYGLGLAVVDGLVFTGALNGNVDAYDAATGDQVWTVDTAGIDVLGVPAVVDGVVYVGSYDSMMYAIAAETGQVLWTTPTGGQVLDSAAVADGVVYVGSTDDLLYAFDAETGEVRWTTPHDGGTANINPVVAGGVVYFPSSDHRVYGYDADTGVPLWSFDTGDFTGEVIVTDGTVYLGSADGHLYAFRLPGGSGP